METWRIGNVEFVRSFATGSTADRFHIRKGETIVDRYRRLSPEFDGSRIVELGIADGGGTALIALLLQPDKLVACELDSDVRPGLAAFIEAHPFDVRPFYGVDQSDRARLAEVVDDEIDLVIDDASHLYEPSVASFETLFPRLRLDGLYVVEDWAAAYYNADGLQRLLADPEAPGRDLALRRLESAMFRREHTEPLARLGVELLLASAGSPNVIAKVEVDRHWLAVRRGPATLDGFRLADLYTDHFGWLTG